MIELASTFVGIGKADKLKLMDYYNRNCAPYVKKERKYQIQPNDEWCAMFTTVIANKCGLGAEKFPYEVSVFYQRKLAIERGLYYTDVSKVKPNDLIVYDWNNNGTYDHVGFVVSNVGGVITAIEGNKNDTVGYRKINNDSPLIEGFISTGYEVAETVVDVDLRVALLAIATLKGKMGNGLERRKNLGTSYDAVQKLIND